jgi:hypothetical protein
VIGNDWRNTISKHLTSKCEAPETEVASGACSGAERDRTVGLLNAIQALSQLSYSPMGYVARGVRIAA